jgi:hypothetical protein
MTTFNFRDYINYSEKYLNLAEDQGNNLWLLIPAIILSWSAIESFVNNRLDDFGALPEGVFELHERAMLLEQRLKFNISGASAGTFSLEGTEYRRLEDKILFLIAKFSKKTDKNIKGDSIWQKFQDFKILRDSLMHPRFDKEVELNITIAKTCVETSKEVIQLLSSHIWNSKIDF